MYEACFQELSILTQINLRTIQWGRCHYYLNFKGEKTEMERGQGVQVHTANVVKLGFQPTWLQSLHSASTLQTACWHRDVSLPSRNQQINRMLLPKPYAQASALPGFLLGIPSMGKGKDLYPELSSLEVIPCLLMKFTRTDGSSMEMYLVS